MIRTRQRCEEALAPLLCGASSSLLLPTTSFLLLQVVASSLADSRGAQRRHLVSRWASRWVCWILDQPMCCMSWCGPAKQNPNVLWSVAAHSPILAMLSAQLVALPCSLLSAQPGTPQWQALASSQKPSRVLMAPAQPVLLCLQAPGGFGGAPPPAGAFGAQASGPAFGPSTGPAPNNNLFTAGSNTTAGAGGRTRRIVRTRRPR